MSAYTFYMSDIYLAPQQTTSVRDSEKISQKAFPGTTNTGKSFLEVFMSTFSLNWLYLWLQTPAPFVFRIWEPRATCHHVFFSLRALLLISYTAVSLRFIQVTWIFPVFCAAWRFPSWHLWVLCTRICLIMHC